MTAFKKGIPSSFLRWQVISPWTNKQERGTGAGLLFIKDTEG
ncbi:hypothetical protein [Paenibacillus sp. Y412MC10]